MSVLVISNEKSGSSEADLVARAGAGFESLGPVTHVKPPSLEAFDADVRRAAQDKKLVVVAGGDGTLNCAVNALKDMHDRLMFAVVPLGTGNDFAHTLGLPEDPIEAARVVAAGAPQVMDVGRACSEDVDRLFVNACMGGFPVEADKAIDEKVKKKVGPLAFWMGGAKAAIGLTRYDVEINGHSHGGVAAVGIGNGRTAGGGIPVFPMADPADGRLECCVFEVDGLLEGLRTAVDLKKGSHVNLPNVHQSAEERIEVRADPALEFNLDGDLVDLRTPVTFEIFGRIRFLIPK